ncbi:MAG: J domain-containing protein [Clostridiales bacterium]|nr:J domain-containing protein [Clostridiales bacterium]
MEYKDYYKILGVEKTTSHDDVKKAFRKLAKKYHPDTHPGDKKSEEKFKEVNEANEVLGDPEKRKKYDQFGQNYNFANGTEFDPSQYGFGNQTGYGGFGNQGGKAGNVKYEYRTTGDMGDFSDFFNAIFGQMGGKSGSSPSSRSSGGSSGFGGASGINSSGGFEGSSSSYGARGTRSTSSSSSSGGFANYASDGEDSEAEIEITPEEGFHGIEKKITISSMNDYDDTGRGRKTISFKIPAGIRHGEKIRLAGQGGPGYNGGRNGDIILIVNFKKGGHFELEGNDLVSIMELTPWDAALGGEVHFKTMEGRILVKIPPGVQSGSRIRVAGNGYKDRSGGRGDLFLKVKIVNPHNLSLEERELYEKLRQVSKFKPGH